MIDECTVCHERMLPGQSCLVDRHENCLHPECLDCGGAGEVNDCICSACKGKGRVAPKVEQAEPEFAREMVECIRRELSATTPGNLYIESILRALRQGGFLRQEVREVSDEDIEALLYSFEGAAPETPKVPFISRDMRGMRDALALAQRRGLVVTDRTPADLTLLAMNEKLTQERDTAQAEVLRLKEIRDRLAKGVDDWRDQAYQLPRVKEERDTANRLLADRDTELAMCQQEVERLKTNAEIRRQYQEEEDEYHHREKERTSEQLADKRIDRLCGMVALFPAEWGAADSAQLAQERLAAIEAGEQEKP